MEATHQMPGSPRSRAYDSCFERLLRSGCIAGLALLDSAQGRPLYENRIDGLLLPRRNIGEGRARRYDLVSADEGRHLVDAVKGLTDEGLCRQEVITCMGVPFRVFGGTPLGIYAVGPGRRVGMIGRSLAGMGYLVVFYRRPHLPQQVVPYVESFVDTFWADVQDFGRRLPPRPPPSSKTETRAA
eukprot:g2230.t1